MQFECQKKRYWRLHSPETSVSPECICLHYSKEPFHCLELTEFASSRSVVHKTCHLQIEMFLETFTQKKRFQTFIACLAFIVH